VQVPGLAFSNASIKYEPGSPQEQQIMVKGSKAFFTHGHHTVFVIAAIAIHPF
jgi:hypothetical protein